MCQYHKFGSDKDVRVSILQKFVRVYQNVETSNNVKKDIPKTAKDSHQEMAAGMVKNVHITIVLTNMWRSRKG